MLFRSILLKTNNKRFHDFVYLHILTSRENDCGEQNPAIQLDSAFFHPIRLLLFHYVDLIIMHSLWSIHCSIWPFLRHHTLNTIGRSPILNPSFHQPQPTKFLGYSKSDQP